MPECYDEDPGQKEIKYSEHFTHFSISKNDPNLYSAIQKIHDEFMPDAMIAVNTYPSYIAAGLNSRTPFWADLNGWVMAEAQAQAFKMGSNDYISHYFEMEQKIIQRADKISCVSDRQKYTVLGELSSIGRLNQEAFGYKFTYSVPNGTEIFEGENLALGSENKEDDAKEIQKKIAEIFGNATHGDICPDDAFVLLWMGGYNNWVDESTLFTSVNDAMDKCKKLYFVSTGGQISGLSNKTFDRLKEMIDMSEHKNRYIFLGWVETSDIPYIYLRATAGLNIDRKCAETYTGARNRINEMMKFGVPVITTLGSEISYAVDKHDAGMAVKSGKHELITEAIEEMYVDFKDRHGSKLREYGENGRKYIKEKCNYDYLAKPLMKWLENPRPAPDRGISLGLGKRFGYANFVGKARGAFTYLKQNGAKKVFKKLVQRIKKVFR